MASWSTYFRSFGVFCGHLVYFMVIWYIFSRFGMLHQEKSGNPALLALGKQPFIDRDSGAAMPVPMFEQLNRAHLV
jgi:hypothetical protein